MNLDNLISWGASVVLGFAAVGRIETLQMCIWKAQAQVLWESRSSNWGSPRFFGDAGRMVHPRKSDKSFRGRMVDGHLIP